jgi:hypothetical protein
MMDNAQHILQEIESFLSEHQLALNDKDLVFMRCFNEAWFSNMLAWLLNPKGSHKLGVSFANEFLKTIARTRTERPSEYMRRSSLLKWGTGGRGTSSTHFSLKNAAVLREFYLAPSIRKRVARGPRYCDIILLDLDTTDSLFVVIENKLFSSNHPYQLEEYYALVEKNFKRAKVREYVYLTLHGMAPIQYDEDTVDTYKYWVRLSWGQHILDILKTLHASHEHHEITQLRHLLAWVNALGQPSLEQSVEALRTVLLKAAARCLHEELTRLGEEKPGTWEMKNIDGKRITMIHTSSPKTPLCVELLPNLSITVQSRRKQRPLFEKIIVPYGTNIDQIYNLLDIAARDVYHYHFVNTTDRYLANKRRLTSTLTPTKKALRPIFEFVFQHQYELKILLTASKYVWQAQKIELQNLAKQKAENG